MSDFRELTAPECPLLGDEAAAILGQFNDALRVLREIDQKFPELLASDHLKARVDELQRVRDKLERKRYLVGFLGRTQDGKSTAFNNLLDAKPEEAPLISGAAGATTSAITRVRRSGTGHHELKVRYLTPAEADQKRKALIEACGWSPNLPDEEVYRKLQAQRKDAARAQAPAAAAEARPRERSSVLVENYSNLENYLNSCKVYKKDFLQPQGLELEIPYAQRSRYLNHPPKDDRQGRTSDKLLIKEGIISFHADRLPDNVEIIDLPGVGSQGSGDTLLTKEFLKDLDGALLFIRAGQIDNQDVELMLNTLHTYWEEGLRNRVWVVLTIFDSLQKEHFFGNQIGETMLDKLQQFLDRHQIAPERVCFSSDRFYKARGPAGVGERQTQAKFMGLEGSTLEEMIPPRFRSHPQLGPAFKDLLEDGGIGRLRRLLVEVLARQVARETAEQARRQLSPLADRLRDDFTAEDRRRKASPTELLNALTCSDRVTALLCEWKGRVEGLDALSRELESGLLEQVHKWIPSDDHVLRESTQEELGNRLEFLGRGMESTLQERMDGGVIEKAFALVGNELAGLPRLRLWGDAGAAEAWERFLAEDRRSQEWRGGFPKFSCRRLFDEGLKLEQRGGYRELMGEKARTASHQALHALKVRVQGRLRELREEVAKLAFRENGGAGAR